MGRKLTWMSVFFVPSGTRKTTVISSGLWMYVYFGGSGAGDKENIKYFCTDLKNE